MTFNALMLPNLAPASAAGLNSSGNLGPAALRSGRQTELTEGSRSFLATLRHVSLRQSNSQHKPASEKITADVTAPGGKEPANTGKTCHAVSDSPEQIEESGTAAPAQAPPIPDPWQVFAMIHRRLLNLSMVAGGTFSNATRTETETTDASKDASNSVPPDRLEGYLEPDGQGSLIDGLAGIGVFEQLQFGLSPEAGNRYLAEQLAAKAAFDQDTGSTPGTGAEVGGFWHQLASAPEVALNRPAGFFAVDVDKLLAALLQMQQTAVTPPDVNADTVVAAGQNAPTDPQALNLIEDLLIKWTVPSAVGESDLPENSKLTDNAKMAGAVKDSLIPVWGTAAPDSEPLLDAPSRKETEDSPVFKVKADVKVAAEPSVNPNFTAAEVAAKPAEDSVSIRNPVLKSEIPTLAEFGNKINAIEGDNKDSGFFFSQNQMPEHLRTLEAAARSLEGARQGLTADTMSQIVQKAVLLVNSDQQEVHIELKPEFLGHIRMQIVTENQQVAIKIAAEFPFVKEMLESNLNQLKAELQAQGLQINALEVSIANDSYADGNPNQKPADSAKPIELSDAAATVDGSSEEPRLSPNQNGDVNGETAIDYFA